MLRFDSVPLPFVEFRTMSLTAPVVQPVSEPVCQTSFGYVLGFDGPKRAVIGIEHDGLWQLPGGPVEGDCVPDASHVIVPPDCGDQHRFAPLAVHLRQQTGLELVRLAGPFAVNVHPSRGNVFDVSMYYLAIAAGEQTAGTLLSTDKLPRFADHCPAEGTFIREFLATGNPLGKPGAWRRLWKWLRGQGA
jgi:hypothetical protein